MTAVPTTPASDPVGVPAGKLYIQDVTLRDGCLLYTSDAADE